MVPFSGPLPYTVLGSEAGKQAQKQDLLFQHFPRNSVGPFFKPIQTGTCHGAKLAANKAIPKQAI